MRTLYRHLLMATMVALVLTIQMLGARPAHAHEEPAASDPPAGSTTPVTPEQVSITFPGEIEAEGSTFQVIGPDGEPLDVEGAADLNNADRNTLVGTLPEGLEPGEYTVEWVVVSAGDGDQTEGTFTFTIDPDAPEQTSPVVAQPEVTPEPVDVTDEEDDGDGIGRGALIVGGVSIAVALIVVLTLGRRAFWR